MRFLGDAGAASEPDQEKLAEMRQRLGAAADQCFHFKPVWQRAIIVAAGPIANFILAIVIFSVLAFSFGDRGLQPIVGQVQPGTPAEAAGFQTGDRIERIAGAPIERFGDIRAELVWRPGEVVTFDILRDGQPMQIEAAARLTMAPDGLGGQREMAQVGFSPNGEPYYRPYNALEALGAGCAHVWRVVSITGRYVGRIVTGRAPANMLNGPVGIVTVSGQVANRSLESAPNAALGLASVLVNLIQLAGLFSIGLGLVNLLPIPMLDGGHLVYYAYESVAGRPLSARVQAIGFRVGLALVLGLMLVATWNDLSYLPGLFS